jgi:hypothetical protein
MTKKLIGTLVAECQDNLLRRGEIRLSPRAYDIHGKIGHVRYQTVDVVIIFHFTFVTFTMSTALGL